MRVFHCHCIESTIIYAESVGIILFLDHDDGARPWAVTVLDDTPFQHVVGVLFNLKPHCW